MQQRENWLQRLWYWRSIYSPEEVRVAREAVAHLKPAVVITGGSRGIGFALAQRFMEGGRNVVILARNAGDLSTACAQLKSATEAEALAVVCDVTQPDAADIIQAELQRAGLYLDVLINNAGAGISGPFLTYPPESVSKLIAVNIESVMRLTRAALPAMIKRQRGGILNVASLGGYVPGPNQAAYYASKAYVLSLTEALMHEVAGQGVRVMAIAPGPVETTFHKDMGADASAYRLLLPSLTPERVARSAYLGFIMGRRVVVPGIVNNALFVALRLFPHVFTVPIVAWLLKRIPKP